jgi:signal transduction histidine kinase/ActR/RegA family two-component response regulator
MAAPDDTTSEASPLRASPLFVARPFSVEIEQPTLDFEHEEFLELLKQVASIARIGVWELDLSSMEPVWSPEVYRIHEVAIGTPMTLERAISFYAEDARELMEEAVQRGIERGVSWDLTLPLITAQGREIWVRALGSPEFREGTCVRLFGTFQDITDQRRAEEQHRELERKLARSEKMEAIGTVAGGVAHEFNNILGGIMGSLELMKISFSTPGTELQSHLDTALSGCTRAAGIIRQMLSFTREECGEKVMCDLREVVSEAFLLLRAGIPDSVSLRQTLSEAAVPVLGDRTQLFQVVVNLVTNAVQALPSASGQVEVSAFSVFIDGNSSDRPEGLTDGSYSVISVSDDGCGIPEHVLERIFDPFFTTKAVGSGTGLGLSVVHGIVRAHGGVIHVNTEPSNGSVFSVYLASGEGPIGRPAPLTERPLRAGRGQRILVVDDESALVLVTEQLLKITGYLPSVVNDPREALRMIRSNPQGFDCLLVDYSMPFLTGPELIAEARVLGMDCPVLLTTGLQDEQLDYLITDLGVSAVLKKPLPAAEILEALSSALVMKNREVDRE